MEDASRDQNFVTTLLGTSSVDGVSPIKVYVDPSTHRLLVDMAGSAGTVTSFTFTDGNGFDGTVTNSTTTPTLSLTTSLTLGSIPFITTAGALTEDNASLFWLAASKTLQLGTGSMYDLFNTADKTTNYEKFTIDFSANIARLYTGFGGSGTARALRIGNTAAAAGAPVRYFSVNANDAPAFSFTRSFSSNVGIGVSLASLTMTGASGTQTALSVAPDIQQTGTTAYTALDVNPTETSTGSGIKTLQRWAVGGTAVGNMYSSGQFYSLYVIPVTALGFSASIGGSIDAFIVREASNTLAQRSGTNAQTFRVYNTYTDGSNYERGVMQWSGNVLDIGVQFAGTGISRRLGFVVGNTRVWSIATAGNFLAESDNAYDIGASGATRPRSLYLGTSLFMPSAGVINWNAGDVTLTHASNLLTLAGGQWTFGANTAYFTQTDNGNSSTADTIDWTLSNKQKSTLTGNCTFTFTAPGGPASLVLECINDGTVRTITWPATVKWSGGTAPTFTGTSGKSDIITFFYNGTVYYGNYTLNFVNS